MSGEQAKECAGHGAGRRYDGRGGPTRRTFLISSSLLALAGPTWARTLVVDHATRAEPVPARFVRLKASPFADAIAADRRYLLSLDPKRLLHNFYLSAGLPTKGGCYGGWEAMGIAGHSLGHWMSACALIVANGGDAEVAARIDEALVEMAAIQNAQGDGYLCGTTVERDGKSVDGKIVFEEVRRGEIHNRGWDLNGGWVPVYTLHKIVAGLLDAHNLAGNPRAMPIALGVAGYFGTIVEGLSDAQVQQLLHTEHGGIAESYAELYALTGDARWLTIARRLRHHAVIDPLAAGRDQLEGLHANTQIPKLIGMARLYEVAGDPADAKAARFFHDRVTHHHSYVIGGNSEREHFGAPDKLAGRLSNATCESCNSYNMLKLTRHLYGWEPRGEWFDYYERVQFNHMLAHQRPDSGMFAYFIPMETGARRDWSTPEDSFWCCVGSGMESHAKHADSIYWQGGRTLFVNLFIPSTLDWTDKGLKLDLDTAYPMDGDIALAVARAPRRAMTIALRIPAWSPDARLRLNGEAVVAERRDGYAFITRRWQAGDKLKLSLDMPLRAEPIAGDPTTLAFVSGPLVLAADLGPADRPFDDTPPALLAEGDPAAVLAPISGKPHHFRLTPVMGAPVEMKPFFPLYDRRTAVYFRTFTPQSWATGKTQYLADEAARADLVRRTVDIFHIGEMQPERDHGFESTRSEPGQFYARSSRRLPAGETMRFRLARRPGAALLRVTYWGNDIDRIAEISVDGVSVATERRPGPVKDYWVVVDYPLPPTAAASSMVAFAAKQGDTVIYEARVIQPEGGST